MEHWKTEEQARETILNLVRQYYYDYKKCCNEFTPGDRIHYAGRVFDEKEMCALVDSSLDFWLTSGRYAKQFEEKFGEWLGVRYVSLVNSGSSANLIAMAVLTAPELGKRQICPGDEVITVAAGFPTTVAPIIQYGAVPVFVDVTIPEYEIDINEMKKALSDRTKAVMLAHTMGNSFNLAEVKKFCETNKLWLIEDNCDALGATYHMGDKDYLTGTIGDIGTSSFYPAHHITMGEGGCVYTNNPLLHKLIRSYRDWGRDCICNPGQDNACKHRFDSQYGQLPCGYDHKFVYSHFGYNLKATDMQAAIGCEQLKKLSKFNAIRRKNWLRLYKALEGVSDKLILPEPTKNCNPCWFGFLITVREINSRKKIVEYLESKGIQTRLLFSGNLIMHPCFDQMRQKGEGYRVIGELPVTNRIMRDTFWIGVYPGMTDQKIDYVAKCICDAVR